MTGMTGILQLIARHAGDAAALRLVQLRGGTKMKFGDRPTSPLAQIIGEAAARAVVEEIGQGPFIIPMANVRGPAARRAAAARLLNAGATAQEVALAVDVHERTARRVRKRMRMTPAGPDLFDRD